MTFDGATLRHVAHLARVPLTEAEAEELTRDLDRILHAFEALSGVEGEGVTEGAAGPLREDAVAPAAAGQQDAIVEAFTARDGRHLKALRGL